MRLARLVQLDLALALVVRTLSSVSQATTASKRLIKALFIRDSTHALVVLTPLLTLSLMLVSALTVTLVIIALRVHTA